MNKLLAFAASVAFASVVHAAPPSAESIDALLAVTKAQALLDGVYANTEQFMRRSMAAATQGKPISEEQQRILDATPGTLLKVMRQEMNFETLRPLYLQVYQETFSQEEVDGMLAFYATPAGQAVIAKMPLLMQKTMQAMQLKMGPIMEKMQAAMAEAVAEAKLPK